MPAMLIYMMSLFLLPQYSHGWDSYCWSSWTIQLKEKGFVSAYEGGSPINYLPLYLYVLKGFSYFFSVEQIPEHIYKLKAITWLFDVASILLLCSLIKSESSRLSYFIFGVLNIGFFYNTIIWNQVDGILTFFIFSTFYFAYFRKTFLSLILFLLGLNFKLQAIVFAPVLLVLWLPGISLKKLTVYVLALVFLQCLIILPFLINGNAKNIINVAFGSVDYFSVVSMNAYNLWHLMLKGNFMEMPDNLPVFFGYTYKSIGLALFFIFSLAICLPLYLKVYKAKIMKHVLNIDLKLMLMSMALICYTFFFFNTQMHERYIHPVIIFLTALAFLYNQWGIWLIVSLNYAFSLEAICNFFKIEQYRLLVFYPVFMAWIYALGLTLLFYEWYLLLPKNAFQFKRVK